MTRELSWEDLAGELEKIRALGALQAAWFAYVGSDDYGIWLLRPQGPELDECRASFSLFAAHAICKRGIPPAAIPQPSEYCPQWKVICEVEEEFARWQGTSLDFLMVSAQLTLTRSMGARAPGWSCSGMRAAPFEFSHMERIP